MPEIGVPGKWHAARWSLPWSSSIGSTSAQISCAIGQRVRKRQPDGGSIGLGTSPVSTIRLLFRPGTETSYSTKGYTVLGDVLVKITAKTYNRLVKQSVGEPVAAASFRADPVFLDSPGGRVYSTIRDMALFAAGVMEGRYVSTDLLLEEAFQAYGEDRFGAIGMGWYCDLVGTPDLLVYHAGSNGRPRAYISLRPIQKTAVVLTGRNRTSDRDYYFRELAPKLLETLEAR